MSSLRDTLDPGLESWVESANAPAAVRREEDGAWHIGVAIGDRA